MESGLVSVVLPIYNVEKYLDRCVTSVVNQSYRNLEIILVDDGSPDNCPAMCDAWAARDARIKVVHKKNAGLGMARNTGIENATGEYICFFDSDDYIAPETIEKCYRKAIEEAADVVSYGFHNVNSHGIVTATNVPCCEKTVYTGTEILHSFLPDLLSSDPITGHSSNLWLSACGALYSMKPILQNNWTFVSEREIISEDVYSLMQFYQYVKKAVVLPEAFYYYCENGSSLTHTYRPDRFQKIQHFYNQCIMLCHSLDFPPKVEQRLQRVVLSYTIAALKQEIHSFRPLKDRYVSAKTIIIDPIFQTAVRQGKSKADGKARKILFFAIERRLYALCFLLCIMK